MKQAEHANFVSPQAGATSHGCDIDHIPANGFCGVLEQRIGIFSRSSEIQ